ncbi:hypothetical protein AB0V79_27185 [Mesorhizobium ciceri]|uniref:hypothetical protein n=1 Tax=Mesorhizobium ciceri TaxID=39645 RepID=UPI00157D8792|nr:hypothetical protein [Mesorhizobium ciceri]
MKFHRVAGQVAFVVALTVVLVLALLPLPRLKDFGIDVGFHYDKLNHGTAFAVLIFLGSLGWPERKITLLIVLTFVGAGIEVLQGLTLIARDVDVLDWVADCIGLACGLAATMASKAIRLQRYQSDMPSRLIGSEPLSSPVLESIVSARLDTPK